MVYSISHLVVSYLTCIQKKKDCLKYPALYQPVNADKRITTQPPLGRDERLRESAHILFQSSMGSQELNVSTIRLELSVLTLLQVLLATEGSEAPVLGDDNLLTAGKSVNTMSATARGMESGGRK